MTATATMKLLAPSGNVALVSLARNFPSTRKSPLLPGRILTHAQDFYSLRQELAFPVNLTSLLATMEGNDPDQQRSISPSLIDVDCNLLHSDLISVMNVMSSLKVDEAEDAFKILHHPSTSKSNIVAMISPSSTLDESERSFGLLESSSDKQRNNVRVKTTVGVHPYHALEEGKPCIETARIRALLDRPNSKQTISCIGETGLDYSEGFPGKEHQIPWFKAQLDLAYEYNLPVFLHERLAFEDTLRCIDETAEKYVGKPIPKIIVHCYTGSFEECVEYMNRGYYTSVSGFINKPGANQVRKCLRKGIIPMDKLMIETDAPYMGFGGNKDDFFYLEGEAFSSLSAKKRKRLKSMYPNVPSSLPLVLRAVCDEINCGLEERGDAKLSLRELAQITTANAISFFSLDSVKYK